MTERERIIKAFFEEKKFWTVRNGIPDLLVWRGIGNAFPLDRSWPEMFWVEVKGKNEKIRPSQYSAMLALVRSKIPVFIMQHIEGNRWRIRQWVQTKTRWQGGSKPIGDWRIKTIKEIVL
jgi:hypothetical protein